MMFAERFLRDGCLVIDRIFEPALIDRVRAEYDRQYGEIDPVAPPLHMKVGDGRLHLAIALRGALLEPALYAHPLIIALLRNVFTTPFLIDSVNVVTAFPGAPDQEYHRDHPPLFGSDAAFNATLPCYALALAIPLTDLDEECGTTQLFAGSMGSEGDGKLNPPPGATPVMPLVQRGGCFLTDYRLWHRGLANRSNRARPILYILYARDWFTDVVNFKWHARLIINRGDVERIPVEHRPLFRRAAGKGLIDCTIMELGAAPPNPGEEAVEVRRSPVGAGNAGESRRQPRGRSGHRGV